MTDCTQHSKPHPPEIEQLLKNFSEDAFSLNLDKNFHDRPIYGTTLYLASCDVDLTCGKFKAHVFQDIIHKGYVIALAYGDIQEAKMLYTRVHSSCVTGETLRGCDCDCADQLEGALKIIAKKKKGVLFYLMQEGRGVGYLAKARDRMLVQATNDNISTFEAYKLLGLNKDYRQYRNIGPICKILNITANFTLLTNNPDKVESLKSLNIPVTQTESLEIPPSPFNLAYLRSKMESGHILEEPLDPSLRHMKPPEVVIPFKPHALKNAQRFIYTASYFLPIKPVANEIVIPESQFKTHLEGNPIQTLTKGDSPLILEHRLLRENQVLIKVHEKNLQAYREKKPDDPLGQLLASPYWFRVHVYSDIATSEDFVVLTYGTPQSYDAPVVRLHSESLFNRLPDKNPYNRKKFMSSLKEIVRYGSGAIMLLYNDGRGAGFGAYAEDLMLVQNNRSKDTNDSYKQLAIHYDSRDYDAAIILLKEHLPHNRIQMIVDSPDSLLRKTAYAKALNHHGIEVNKWIFLQKKKV